MAYGLIDSCSKWLEVAQSGWKDAARFNIDNETLGTHYSQLVLCQICFETAQEYAEFKLFWLLCVSLTEAFYGSGNT